MASNRKPKTSPIWERLGFATQNQYRNEQARKLTNPDTGNPFTSYRQLRDQRARAKGAPRDTAAERERADIRARRQGFQSARDRQERAKRRRLALSVDKTAGLAKWGVSESTFNKYRRLNRAYSDSYTGGYTSANTYDANIDADTKNYSDERVGYIVTFYHAVVDPKNNYASLFEGKRRPKEYGFLKSNRWQKMYLVNYAGIMSQNEFESRYGKFYN